VTVLRLGNHDAHKIEVRRTAGDGHYYAGSIAAAIRGSGASVAQLS
jgi:hypothetical protein